MCSLPHASYHVCDFLLHVVTIMHYVIMRSLFVMKNVTCTVRR